MQACCLQVLRFNCHSVLLSLTTVLDLKTLTGQSGVLPVHFSGTSQKVVALRHTCRMRTGTRPSAPRVQGTRLYVQDIVTVSAGHVSRAATNGDRTWVSGANGLEEGQAALSPVHVAFSVQAVVLTLHTCMPPYDGIMPRSRATDTTTALHGSH